MTGKCRTRQPIVVMKQGNTCGVKGHSQATNDTMTEPDWEAVVQTWINPQKSLPGGMPVAQQSVYLNLRDETEQSTSSANARFGGKPLSDMNSKHSISTLNFPSTQ